MRTWRNRFRVAASGIAFAFRDQVSFWVHLPVTCAVIALAVGLGLERWQWVSLLLAISSVLVAEMLNSAIELLVKALHPTHHPVIGRALDVSAGGVLIAAMIAVTIGLIVLGPELLARVSG